MKNDLSLAIVTYQREKKLSRCLESIKKQITQPKDIFITDNDKNKSSFRVYSKYKKHLPLKYYCEPKQSVPKARNLALQKCTTKYLAFVDDDCVLTPSWIQVGLKKIKKNTCSFVVGNTKLLNTENIIAIAQHQRDTYWRQHKLQQYSHPTSHHVDTKNIILNTQILKKYKIKFDENCVIGPYDSADFDLGLQLENKRIKGVYNKKMVLYHEETPTIIRFVKRAYARGKIASYLNRKWQLQNILVNDRHQSILMRTKSFLKNFKKEINMYTKNLSISFPQKIYITVFIKLYEFWYLLGYYSLNTI